MEMKVCICEGDQGGAEGKLKCGRIGQRHYCTRIAGREHAGALLHSKSWEGKSGGPIAQQKLGDRKSTRHSTATAGGDEAGVLLNSKSWTGRSGGRIAEIER